MSYCTLCASTRQTDGETERQTLGFYLLNLWAHFSLTHSSYLPSLRNCSAFKERKPIIKIAIIKKVIYIINFQWVGMLQGDLLYTAQNSVPYVHGGMGESGRLGR